MKRKNQRRGRDSGFTLTEVIIAGAIAVVSLVVVGSALSTGQRSASMAARQVQAMHKARSVLENVTRLSFHDGALSVGRHTVTSGHYDVTQVDERTKDVVVRILWVGPNNATNWVALTTSVSASLHY